MMKLIMLAVLLGTVCMGVYLPHKNAEFVLDDYYTVVRNPLIKNPSLYQKIWTSRLFDAHQSSSYIKFGYYRPILETSWILDYKLFGLKASGFQWGNLLIHALNCFLVYLLFSLLFGQIPLALKASLLFCTLPSQEWVVRYVTGRGDLLSVFFAMLALLTFYWVLKNGFKLGYLLVFVLWVLAALTREVAISYGLYAFILIVFLRKTNTSINRFSLYWILIGLLPFLFLWSIIPKQGNILCLHVLYMASIGLCLWMAQLRIQWFIVLCSLFTLTSVYQGQFWTTEQNLLRHTKSLEYWPGTVVDQQLLMKYDQDIPAIKEMIDQSQVSEIKAMWLRRLGLVYFEKNDFNHAQEYFSQALSLNPLDVDTLNALAVVYHQLGQDNKFLQFLNKALTINPSYPDTLRNYGIYYYLGKDYDKARFFLNRCLIFEPDNIQARDLLRLANQSN